MEKKPIKHKEIVAECVNRVIQIIDEDPNLPHHNFIKKYKDDIKSGKDILVFLTSMTELNKACLLLKEKLGERVVITPNKNATKEYEIGCFPLSATIKEEIKKNLKDTSHKELGIKRKVIFSTNVAEASVTINSLLYVIDSGREQASDYDYINNEKTLKQKFISRAQILQRLGRVGRNQPGVVYMLYTPEEYDNMDSFKKAAIETQDFSDRILSKLASGESINFDNCCSQYDYYISAPNKLGLYNSCKLLIDMGCLNRHGEITQIGKYMDKITAGIELKKVLLYSFAFDCVEQIAIIISMIQTSTKVDKFIELDPKDEKQNKLLDKLIDTKSDFFTLLNIFYYYYKLRDPYEKIFRDKKMNIENEIENLNEKDTTGNKEKINELRNQLEKYEKDLKDEAAKLCIENKLNPKNLETAYENINRLWIVIKDLHQINIKKLLFKNNRVIFKSSYYFQKWLGREINIITNTNSNTKDINNPKYRENITRCLLSGLFRNIAVKHDDNKFYEYNSDSNLTIGDKDKKKKSRSLVYNPNSNTKFVLYADKIFMPGFGRNANICMEIEDPTLFLEPGLIYFYDSSPTAPEQIKLRESWLNILSTYDLNLKSYGYRFSFANSNN